jgi:hypothetical protein
VCGSVTKPDAGAHALEVRRDNSQSDFDEGRQSDGSNLEVGDRFSSGSYI